jgi:hypothetical protein
MKEKRFFQLNIFWVAFSLTFPAIGIAFGVSLIQELGKINIGAVLIILIFMGIMVYLFVQLMHLRITFENDYLFMPSDWNGKSNGAQFKTTVKYSEIVDIKLIRSRHNSLGVPIKTATPLDYPKTYMELTCKDDKVYRLLVLHFTRKQRIKIIEEIKNRMVLVGNTSVIKDAEVIVNELPEYKFSINGDGLDKDL